MELIPIVKLAFTVFSIAVIVIVTISYTLYKIKNRNVIMPKVQPTKVKQTNVNRLQKQDYDSKRIQALAQLENKEQLFLVPVRNSQFVSQKIQNLTPQERFKILNSQKIADSNLKILKDAKLYYHPAQETPRYTPKSNNQNLFDSYSSGGDRLYKLNLGPSTY